MSDDNRIAELERQIAQLPVGSVVYKTIPFSAVVQPAVTADNKQVGS